MSAKADSHAEDCLVGRYFSKVARSVWPFALDEMSPNVMWADVMLAMGLSSLSSTWRL